MTHTVDVASFSYMVNRALNHISVNFDNRCSKTAVGFLTKVEDQWHNETKSKMHFSKNTLWLVFDTEEDYIRFLLKWS